MVDIHCHIIPGIDDGAMDINVSSEMLLAARETGVSNVIGTPHFNAETEEIEVFIKKRDDAYNYLLETMNREGISGISVHTGCEVLFSPDFIGHIHALKRCNPRWRDIMSSLCLARSRYILLEFPFFGNPLWAKTALYDLFMLGYIPVIAHPERYSWMTKMIDEIEEWLNMGVLLQVNTGSFFTDKSDYIRKNLKLLLKHEYIHFIASDGHDSQVRIPVMPSLTNNINIKNTRIIKKALQNSEDLLYNKTVMDERDFIKTEKTIWSYIKRK